MTSLARPVSIFLLCGMMAFAPAASASVPDSGGASSTTATTYPESVRFRQISTADGLSHPVVQDILQDSMGFIWLATEAGLDKYDGYQFTSYLPDPDDPTSLRYDIVRAVYEDSDGVIWVGHGGGLDRMDRSAGTFSHVYTHGQVFSILEDHAGTLWIGTWRGLYGINRSTGMTTATYEHNAGNPDDPRGLSHNFVNTLYEDDKNNLWVGTNGGLDRMDIASGLITHFRHDPANPASLSDNGIQAIFSDSQGDVWVGTSTGGLNRFDDADRFYAYRHDPENPDSLSDNTVTSIVEDHDGALWIGTPNGLNRLDRDRARFEHFQHDPGNMYSLSDDLVFSLYVDRSGIVWIGTLNGLSKHDKIASNFYRIPELVNNKITVMVEDEQENLWLGGLDGLFRLNRANDDLVFYEHLPDDPASISSGNVESIFVDSSGMLWIGTGSGWLDMYDPVSESFSHVHMFDHAVSSIAEDPGGNLWVGIGFNEGLYVVEPESGSVQLHIPQGQGSSSLLSHGNVTSLYIDPSGVLWAGTFGGINMLPDTSDLLPPKFLLYQHDSGDPQSLAHNRVGSFYDGRLTGSDVMWVGTAQGLDRLDLTEQAFTHYTVEDGLIGNMVTCILADSAGLLWLSTSKGLSSFDPQAGTFRNFDARDGIPGTLSRACLRTKTGEMLFGGTGVVAFSPEQIQSSSLAPPIVITATGKPGEMRHTEIMPGEHINLAYDENSIAFEYAALDYALPEKNQYAYMMEGLDEGWTYTGTRRYSEYRNLPPGNYTFHVKGSNRDGVWNEVGASIAVTVATPFWRTGWFLGFAGALSVGLSFAAYRVRVRSIEARSRSLEKQVEQRTAELKQEIDQRLLAEKALRERAKEQAIIEERSRLARELHDSITQSLYSSTLLAEAGYRTANSGNMEETRSHLARLGTVTQQALKEMRLLVYQLRPLDLQGTGLAGALQQRLDSVERRAGMKAELRLHGEIKLPPDIEEALYRIAQEALNNALKHAEPSSVTVAIDVTTENRVEISIKDNGIGFDPEAVSEGGIGLSSMRERADQLGGNLIIKSAPGAGTTVTLTVAVPPETKDRVKAGL